MSRKFLTSIDLSKNQLIAARLENLGAAPSSPAVGQIYFDTTGGVLQGRIWDGTAWQRGSFLTDPFARSTHTGTQLAATISNFDTQVRTNTLSQMAAPTATVTLNGQKLTSGAAATADSDIPTYRQLLDIAQNKSFKDPVRVIATTNIALTGTQTIDGVAVIAGERVLAAGQTTSAERGIYVVAAGVWSRSPDFDVSADAIPGTIVPVTEGTVNADTQWQLTTNGPITLGTTALTFTQFGAAGGEIGVAGAGLTKTGTTYDVGQGTGLSVLADSVGIAAGGVGTTQLADAAVTGGVAGAGVKIAALTIVNANVNAAAAIARAKLDFGTGLVNSDISTTAAIALSKLATDPLARAGHTGTQIAATISDFNTAVRTNALNLMAAPTAAVAMNAQKITGLADGTVATDGATKGQLDTSVTGMVKKYAASFGDGTAVAYTITHNLNTLDVTVSVYDNTTPFAEVECDVEHTTVNTITLRFAIAPTASQYRVVVNG